MDGPLLIKNDRGEFVDILTMLTEQKDRIEELESFVDRDDLADGEIQLAGCPECETKKERIAELGGTLKEVLDWAHTLLPTRYHGVIREWKRTTLKGE